MVRFRKWKFQQKTEQLTYLPRTTFGHFDFLNISEPTLRFSWWTTISGFALAQVKLLVFFSRFNDVHWTIFFFLLLLSGYILHFQTTWGGRQWERKRLECPEEVLHPNTVVSFTEKGLQQSRQKKKKCLFKKNKKSEAFIRQLPFLFPFFFCVFGRDSWPSMTWWGSSSSRKIFSKFPMHLSASGHGADLGRVVTNCKNLWFCFVVG